jgi:hypothetical protein
VADLQDQYLGHFLVQGRRLFGQVSLKGEDSKLEVFSDRDIALKDAKSWTIRGVARSGEKITVCDAIGAGSSGHSFYYGTSKHFLSFFPHHVAVGPRHIDTTKKDISGISFTLSGAIDIFYDIGAFGSASSKNVRSLMPAWAKKDRRKIQYSRILYYADRGPIISAEAADVQISVFNAGIMKMPSPNGIDLKNEVRISIKFDNSRQLAAALSAVFEFRLFCEVVSQTKQCIRNVSLRHKNSGDDEARIQLASSYEETDAGRETDFRDNLVSGGLHRAEFKHVLERWMKSHSEHQSARQRIVQGFRVRIYTIDRLVGAANAFDLLPDPTAAKPLSKKVMKTLAALKQDARSLASPYREQILNSLGRVQGRTLRKKIEARFGALPSGLRQRLPEMAFVIDHCIRTRNYFVHGSEAKLSAAAIQEQIYFMTDTLEFIFIASELSRCGWKFARWLEQSTGGRFKSYLRSYVLSLQELKTIAPPGKM